MRAIARITKERVEEIVGEPVLAFANGQSLESRYGKSVQAGGALASGLLSLRVKGVRRSDAVQLPRFVWIAVGEKAVHLFAHRQAANGVEPYVLGSVERSSLETEIKQGLFWTRLTLIDRDEGRSYMAFQSRLTAGRPMDASCSPRWSSGFRLFGRCELGWSDGLVKGR